MTVKVTAEALAAAREEGAALSAGLEKASALIEVLIRAYLSYIMPLGLASTAHDSRR